jgi:hypothetical protein
LFQHQDRLAAINEKIALHQAQVDKLISVTESPTLKAVKALQAQQRLLQGDNEKARNDFARVVQTFSDRTPGGKVVGATMDAIAAGNKDSLADTQSKIGELLGKVVEEAKTAPATNKSVVAKSSSGVSVTAPASVKPEQNSGFTPRRVIVKYKDGRTEVGRVKSQAQFDSYKSSPLVESIQ